MNTKDFIKILKRVIKDEVRTVIKEELKAIKPSINEYSGGPYEGAGDLSKPSKDALRHRPIPKTGQVGIKGILQETADALRSGTSTGIEADPTDEWPDINPAGTLQAENAQGFATMDSMQQTEAPYQPTGTGTDQFVKDYSDTLAKSIAITSGNNK